MIFSVLFFFCLIAYDFAFIKVAKPQLNS